MWPRPGQTHYFSTFSALLPVHVPDATPVAVRQQKESDQVPTPGGEREMQADVCQQKTCQCDKGPWSTGEGQLTLLDLAVAVGTVKREVFCSRYKTVNHLFSN